jgi:hypothetical protein
MSDIFNISKVTKLLHDTVCLHCLSAVGTEFLCTCVRCDPSHVFRFCGYLDMLSETYDDTWELQVEINVEHATDFVAV